MRTVCVVITARPSYARIRTVLDAIERRGDLQLKLVVTGSALLYRYGSVFDDIHHAGHKADALFYSTVEGDGHAAMVQSTALLAQQLAGYFINERPDIVVTIADRYETLGTAMAASYMNIKLAHIQGGELTGSIDDKVRHAITQLADYHYTATHLAGARVADMRRVPGTWDGITVAGCPSIDIAKQVKDTYTHRFDPFEKYGGVGPKFSMNREYYVVLQHPVTTHADTSRRDMLATLMALRETRLPAFIFWPNVDSGSDGISKLLREYREQYDSPWHFFRHLEAADFLRLLLGAKALIGNSSVGIRECSFLGVPVVNIGDRQDARERGPNVLEADPEQDSITDALDAHAYRGRPKPSTLYGDGEAGVCIAQSLAQVSC